MAKVTASQRARRLLALLHLLKPDERIALQVIADTLGTSVAQVTSDLESLACCGLAPYTPDLLVPLLVEDGYAEVFGHLPTLSRPVRLSQPELQALISALESAGVSADDPLLKRLADAAAPAVSRDEIEQTVLNRSSVSADVLRSLAQALSEHRRVEIVYRATGRETDTTRTIEPLGMLNERGVWYVEAMCLSAGALRTFRADRVRTATVTDERFEPMSFSPLTGAFDAEGLPVALLRFDAEDEFVTREWPSARITGRDHEGRLLVEVPFGGTGWISRQVVARLGSVSVLAPDAVRGAVAALATASRP